MSIAFLRLTSQTQQQQDKEVLISFGKHSITHFQALFELQLS